MTRIKKFKSCRDNSITNNIPEFLIKNGIHTIWSNVFMGPSICFLMETRLDREGLNHIVAKVLNCPRVPKPLAVPT